MLNSVRACFIFIMLLCTLSAHASSQFSEVLHSKYLNEKRIATVKLPDSYSANTSQKYPVIYRLDGKENIPVEYAITQKLHVSGARPEAIIVAIENTDRTRDLTPTVNHDPRGPVGQGGGADKFLDYIEKELIPHINSKYRTQDFKVISGASIGGLFAIHSLRTRPDLFQAHIAYSPAVWWGDRTTVRLMKQFIKSRKSLNNYLYLNIGEEGGEMREVYDDFANFMQQNKPEGLQLEIEAYDGVAHGLTSAVGAFNAYHKLFLSSFMPRVELTDGVTSIKAYFQRVSQQRGETIEPSEWNLRSFGYQLVESKEFEQAIAIFKYNTELRPKTPDALNALAYGYEEAGQFKNALEQVKLALKYSKPGDPGYDVFTRRQDRLLASIAKNKL